jgi:hypothetical protein
MRKHFLAASLLFLLPALLVAAEPNPAKESGLPWKPLFDGTTLDGWKSTNFGGEGETIVEKGLLVLEMGEPLTGVTFQDPKKLLKTNYEISLEAMRLKGTDFFCGLTFPVREKEHCSLIIGGWGGGLCGISCLDGMDASENETSSFKELKSDKWYKVRVVVTNDKLQSWLDDEKIVDVSIKDRRVHTRIEVDLSQPFGLSAFRTKAALRVTKRRVAANLNNRVAVAQIAFAGER